MKTYLETLNIAETSYHRYTIENHYWIATMQNGENRVRTEDCDVNITLFTGRYDECVKYIDNLIGD